MKRGDIVRYSKPVNQEEATFLFVLLAPPEKDRVDIRLICEEHIKPIETVAFEEIEWASSERPGKAEPVHGLRDRPRWQSA